MGLRAFLERRRQRRRAAKLAAVVEAQPQNPLAWVRHAEALALAGEREGALCAYRAAAGLLRDDQQWARAEAVLKQALTLAPEDPQLSEALREAWRQRFGAPRKSPPAPAPARAARPLPPVARGRDVRASHPPPRVRPVEAKPELASDALPTVVVNLHELGLMPPSEDAVEEIDDLEAVLVSSGEPFLPEAEDLSEREALYARRTRRRIIVRGRATG